MAIGNICRCRSAPTGSVDGSIGAVGKRSATARAGSGVVVTLREVRRSFFQPTVALLSLLLAAPFVGRPAHAAKPHVARRASARTGLIVAQDDELVRAVRKRDRGALERLAERMGPAHLGEALLRPDPAVVEAALVALPLARGSVLLIGTVADLLESPNVTISGTAARVLGQLLDGAEPSALEDWEVPADLVDRACGALRALASRVEAPVASRVAALGAVASAATICTATGELASLLRDPVPAVRRATALVLRPEERRAGSALREAIRDPERSVASAAVATLCRAEPPDPGAGGSSSSSKSEAPTPAVVAAARVMVAARGTPISDAVEMMGCLARASTPADRQILDQLRRGSSSPLRDRAAELAGSPDRLKPQ
jgi:hypothetical protein